MKVHRLAQNYGHDVEVLDLSWFSGMDGSASETVHLGLGLG